MRHNGKKKLSLSRETLRDLSSNELLRAGGMCAASLTGTCDSCGDCVPSPGTLQTCVTKCVCSAVCQ